MIKNRLHSFNKLSISQKNVPLQYLVRSMALFMVILPVRILFMQQWITAGHISILTGWLFLMTALLELPTGAFADLVGKKVTVIASFLFQAVAMFFFLRATDLLGFGIAISFQGLSEALRSGAFDALTYDSLLQDKREGEYRSIHAETMKYTQISMVIAAILGGWIGSFDLRLPFVLFLGAQLLAATLTTLMEEPVVDTQKFTIKNYYRQTIDGTRHLFHSSKVRILALLYFLVGGIGWTFQRLVRDLALVDVGFGSFEIGAILAGLRLINIFLLVKIVRSKTLIKRGWDLLLLPILMVMSYTPGLWLNKWNGIFVVAGIMIVGTGRFMILSPYLQQEIASKYRATAMSAANLLVSVILAINMFGFGALIDRFGLGSVISMYGLLSLVLVIPVGLKARSAVLEN